MRTTSRVRDVGGTVSDGRYPVRHRSPPNVPCIISTVRQMLSDARLSASRLPERDVCKKDVGKTDGGERDGKGEGDGGRQTASASGLSMFAA